MRRVRRVLGIGLLASAVVVGLGGDGAQGADLAQTGWWWRVQDSAVPVTLPAPPTVPEGGFMVAGAPDGATAVAAIRYELAADEAAPVLTLTVAQGGDRGGSQAVLAACLTGSVWQPDHGGRWIDKPFPACDEGSVTGVRSDDGATWTFALAPLLSDGLLDVMLVPGTVEDVPDGANGSTFELVFDAPTNASLETSAGTSPTFDVPDAGGFSPPQSDFGAPSFDPPPAPAGGFVPSLPKQDRGLTATAPVVQQRNDPLPAVPAPGPRESRAIGALVIALAGGALLWSARPDRAAVPEVAHVAGLGRFARPRTGTPPRLS